MKPKSFAYVRPDSVEEAVDLLAQHGEDARIIAGGQSLMAMLNLRLVEPSILVDISQLKELSEIGVRDGAVEVGASVTQARLLAWPELKARAPFIALALPWVGHFQTRNRGTVCGSIAHADPSSELPLSLRLLGGEVVLRSKKGSRKVKAEAFQQGLLTTARRPDELITAVRFPVGVGAEGAGFREVARRHGDFAIVAVGAVKVAGSIRVAVGGVADRPGLLELPAGGSEAERRQAIEDFAWELGGYDDIHASARYRRDLVRRLAPIIISEAA
ncbi:FAD binding domain-containing protein [Propylenella binzhouense]|uniref:Carbon monoxide dehydrogenase n=1 Tax=Propylenella binzhouense TaxID=2555902 RepID=A0A964T2D2_9HYPH|nr:carbon monoxide dehydrogenase [Propylenella binzhouense]